MAGNCFFFNKQFYKLWYWWWVAGIKTNLKNCFTFTQRMIFFVNKKSINNFSWEYFSYNVRRIVSTRKKKMHANFNILFECSHLEKLHVHEIYTSVIRFDTWLNFNIIWVVENRGNGYIQKTFESIPLRIISSLSWCQTKAILR